MSQGAELSASPRQQPVVNQDCPGHWLWGGSLSMSLEPLHVHLAQSRLKGEKIWTDPLQVMRQVNEGIKEGRRQKRKIKSVREKKTE